MLVSGQTAQSLTLAWNASASASVTGYRLYYGTASGSYSYSTNVGLQTAATIAGLQSGRTYYFAATARDGSGRESSLSNEVSYNAPVSPPSPPVVSLTAPAQGISYVAPADVRLSASVLANNHAISRVRFYNNSALLGEDPAAPYAFDWNNVAAGSYSLKAQAVYESGAVSSLPVTIFVVDLSPPWRTMDMGAVGLQGGAQQSGGTFTVSGAGNLQGRADAFRLVYQTLSGDGQITARMNSSALASSALSGVMIREALTPGSSYVMVAAAENSETQFRFRSGTYQRTRSWTSNSSAQWIRLTRQGDVIAGYRSSDGVQWSSMGRRTIPMAANIYVGLAVASGDSNRLTTATFSNLTVIP